ncbi:MAG: putative metal-binding motif-containing protein, partial [Myxococcales bacterium]|nr:putative metal-binding motif-containing protein [Myxococcales bacterium]
PEARTPARLYQELLAVSTDAQAAGCGADGSWLAGRYVGEAWDGVWSDTGVTRGGSGTFDKGSRRILGELETAAGTETLGWSFSAYDGARHIAADVDGGYVSGVWVRVAGGRGIFVTLRTQCPDDATALAAADAEVRSDLTTSCEYATRYVDGDGDGYGDISVVSCPAAGAVDEGGDCDDADGARSPGFVEVCNGVDDDCDLAVDEDDLDTPPALLAFWPDLDGDLYGDACDDDIDGDG